MEFQEFGATFPDLAAKETRTAVLQQGWRSIPIGSYTFLEMYCTDPSCDCRRVMINVINQTAKQEAFLSYGWEHRDFYVKWVGFDDESVDQISGVNLYPMQPQGPYHQDFLAFFQQMLHEDAGYAQRIKQHYQQIKSHQFQTTTEAKAPISIKTGKKIGRNDPCPCNSGKKAKKCCLIK